MSLIIHILIALTSVVYATYLFISPSKTKLHINYALVAATLASGTYLVWASPTSLVQACTSGLIYIGAVSVFVLAARHKLAKADQED